LGTPAPASSGGTDTSPADPVPSIEVQVFALINQVRQAHGIPALVSNDQLTQAAQIQATAMATLDEMSHELPGMPQPTFQSRLQFVGYSYQWAAENLAYGVPDAPSVVALWMGSPPHEANILSPIPTSTGVAIAYDSRGILYFCQVFGEPR
jgi:uncharacterized protein YkwD